MAAHIIHPIPLIRNEGVSTYKMTHLVGHGSPQTRGSYIWYIEGPRENIIVDAGSSVELPSTSGAGSIMFPGGHSVHIQTLEQGLRKYGLKPEDIDIVILTHAHEDHVQLAHKYPKAKFIIQKAELDFARNPHPIQHFTYAPELIEGLNFEIVEGDTQIVDGVSVMLTPGHSPGGQSVIVETARGKAAITGLCCIRQNFEPPPELKLAVIPTGIHVDPFQSYDSLIKIKNTADIILPLHDGEFLEVESIP